MKTINLDYREAAVLGGMPRTSSELTLSEYMYACGFTPPRHPVPAIRENTDEWHWPMDMFDLR